MNVILRFITLACSHVHAGEWNGKLVVSDSSDEYTERYLGKVFADISGTSLTPEHFYNFFVLLTQEFEEFREAKWSGASYQFEFSIMDVNNAAEISVANIFPNIFLYF